jgi:dolichol-phosphate mannosyltransferase
MSDSPVATRRKLISIVIPAYNEQDNLPAAYDRVTQVMQPLAASYDYEAIILDNGSEDETERVATSFCERDPRWRYVRYSRNFGFEASLLAGLTFAAGDAVIYLLSDLQDPPELIPEFIRHWEKGLDVVYGMVQRREDSSWLKSLGAKIAYSLIYNLTECRITRGATDFRLLDRKVVDVLKELRESDRYMRGLVHWVGFRQTGIPYNRVARERGLSNANLLYCIQFALHAIVCFSSRPMHLSMLCGLLFTAGSVLLGLLYTILYLTQPTFLKPPPPGVATLILLGVFLIGMNSLFLGIIGEYVGRIYNQGKRRPIYIVAKKVNFDSSNVPG